MCLGIEGRGMGLYSSDEKNTNGRAFNEGWQKMRENHKPRPKFIV